MARFSTFSFCKNRLKMEQRLPGRKLSGHLGKWGFFRDSEGSNLDRDRVEKDKVVLNRGW